MCPKKIQTQKLFVFFCLTDFYLILGYNPIFLNSSFIFQTASDSKYIYGCAKQPITYFVMKYLISFETLIIFFQIISELSQKVVVSVFYFVNLLMCSKNY